MATIRVMVSLHPGDIELLLRVAAGVGAVATRGPTLGQASISRLMRMLARGDVRVARQEPDG